MKKRLFNILCFILSIAFTLGGCTSSDSSSKVTEYNEAESYKGGLHHINATKTDSYLVKSGKSDYFIVVPDQRDDTLYSAANELQALISEATGAMLNVVKESELPQTAKYVSLGNTAISQTNGVSVDGLGLNSHGYVVKTVNNNIFIKSGGSSFGVLWGVYEMLEYAVGYNCVAYDTWTFDANLNGNAFVYDYNVVDNPDIELRLANNGVIYTDSAAAQKLRFVLPHKDVYIASIKPYHNFFHFIPKAEYQATHSKWYSLDGKQLCLTAQGDEQEYNALVATMVETVKEYIVKEPDKKILVISQEDENVWCKCSACTALYNEYGTDAASYIMFLKDVAEKIEQWLDAEHNGREVLIAMFAYQKTESAPVKKNANGTYAPIDNKVVLRDNMAVMYAPVDAEHIFGLDQPTNATCLEQMIQWGALCSNFGYWGYTTNYVNYMVMYNSFSVAQNTYRTILETLNPRWIFDQGQHNTGNHTAFTHFKIYLNSQWSWDVNRNFVELKKNFFDTYFGAASEPMQKLFDAYSTHMNYLQEEFNTGAGIMENVVKQESFAFNTVKTWLGYIDEAYKAIEVYKNDKELYDKYYNHINLEGVSMKFLMLKLHQGRLSNDELIKMKTEFNQELRIHGITNLGTGARMDEFI